MKARGKREARRPWIASLQKALSPEKGEIRLRYFGLSGLIVLRGA